MAVYFDNRIQSSSVTANTDLLWHSSYALLAVASENAAGVGGSVNFFLDEVTGFACKTKSDIVYRFRCYWLLILLHC